MSRIFIAGKIAWPAGARLRVDFPRRGANELVNLPDTYKEATSMMRAAIGVRMHSGWGVLVAVSAGSNSVDVLDRRRIVTSDPSIPRAKQPYHYAASLGAAESEKHIANCAAVTERLSLLAVGEVVKELERRDYRIAGCAVLLASGRPLPSLAKILASHPLIHTAEGEFFREAVRKACERLNIPVTAIPEREVGERAKKAFGNAASRVQRRIASMGSSIGPPWTKDHKAAALAAVIILAARHTTVAAPGAALIHHE
jgi:hypothetical protein